MLVSSLEMLLNAQRGKYAIPAFNIENLEMLMGVCKGAYELKSPVIIQTTPSTLRLIGTDYAYAMVSTAAKQYDIPTALHLDHGDNYNTVLNAIRSGYTSLMIDGSKLEFQKNISTTKGVVDMAKCLNIPVEAELGKVGGKEDDVVAPESCLTDPDEAVKFVDETGIDSLAVAIGTAHGLYKGLPRLDFDRLGEIRKVVSIPLVLHGGTGIPEDYIKRCIELGISKVNFATELRIAATTSVRSVLADEKVIDPKVYMKEVINSVSCLVKNKIMVCNSQNRNF